MIQVKPQRWVLLLVHLYNMKISVLSFIKGHVLCNILNGTSRIYDYISTRAKQGQMLIINTQKPLVKVC